MSISAKMQPTLQISAGLPYECEPSSTSGALYHLVATSSVNMTSWLNLSATTDLASPKSHIFMLQSLLSSKLEGFKSLCIISAECRYLIPLQSWYKMKRLWASLSIFCLNQQDSTLWRCGDPPPCTRIPSKGLCRFRLGSLVTVSLCLGARFRAAG